MTATPALAPGTVTITSPAGDPPGSGHYSDTLDQDKLQTAYQMLQAYLDANPMRAPFRCSVMVYRARQTDLEWPPAAARRYATAARVAYTPGIAPVTGRPATGLAAVSPGRVQQMRNLVRSAMPETLDGDQAATVADRVLNLLADAGYLS
jgi:hypothetical protein